MIYMGSIYDVQKKDTTELHSKLRTTQNVLPPKYILEYKEKKMVKNLG